MDIQEVLQWTDEQVFTKTGKHLDSLQKAILEGTLQRQKYPKIALNSHLSYNHVKKAAWELWKLLSDVLEENINQSNFRSISEKWKVSNISNICPGDDYVRIVGNINVCGENSHSSDVAKKRSPSSPSSSPNPEKCYDLSEAPQLTWLCDRPQELNTLKQWILEDKTRLITLLGLSGIGKSAIALQLIPQIKEQFDYIIWRSLHSAPTLETLQTELIPLLSSQQTTNSSSIVPHLRSSFSVYPSACN